MQDVLPAYAERSAELHRHSSIETLPENGDKAPEVIISSTPERA
jgi:hypothetical protein